jgi:hypothetical protein
MTLPTHRSAVYGEHLVRSTRAAVAHDIERSLRYAVELSAPK